MLIPPFSDSDDIQAIIKDYNKPFVSIASKNNTLNQSVACDEVKADCDVTHYLISLGHTRIGFINYWLGHAAGTWRRNGYLKAHTEAGIQPDTTLMVERTFDISSVEYDIRKMLSTNQQPSAIFTVNDFLAGTVYRIASQLNIRIPHDLSVIGIDDDPGAQFLWPPLTTIRQPVRELGKEAVMLLVKRHIMKHDVTTVPLLSCELINRNSASPKL